MLRQQRRREPSPGRGGEVGRASSSTTTPKAAEAKLRPISELQPAVRGFSDRFGRAMRVCLALQ